VAVAASGISPYGEAVLTFVMIQGVVQSFLVRLPFSYLMSVHMNHSLVYMGLAYPAATVIGITICIIYYCHFKKTLS
jgi:Na+-driven multidrug efflux pump